VFGGHGQDYFYDNLTFAISFIPFFFIAALIAASYLEETLRVGARKIAPIERRLTPATRLADRARSISRDRAA
jgi:hypothetical protein